MDISANSITTEESDIHTTENQLPRILAELYGSDVAAIYEPRFKALIEKSSIAPKQHKVSERDVLVIAYGDHLKRAGEASLKTLHTFSQDHLAFINSIHILPHYPSTSDDGFAVSDYTAVNPSMGSWQDIDNLAKDFYLMLDAVFNHSSTSHKWFKGFLADDPKYKDHYIVLDKNTDVSLVTRPRAHPLLTPFETPSGVKYVWTTFSVDQADLNYANPEVLLGVTEALLLYLAHGASLIRFDAVAFVWKELGTSSLHQPKTYVIVRFIREVMRVVAPGVILVTETNVPHKENLSYFGDGLNAAQMIYNFALPPLLVHTLQTGSVGHLSAWASTLKTPTPETYFFNFTASHDGIGVRPVQAILTDAEISSMCDQTKARGGYVSMKTNTDGSQSVYEMNISYFDAVADPLAALETQVNQFMCSQAIALSLQGVPGIYMHSILGSRNWKEGPREVGESRAINRQRLQADQVEEELKDPTSLRSRVLKRYEQLLSLRTHESAFSPSAPQMILDYGPSVFAIERAGTTGKLLALFNVTNKEVQCMIKGNLRDIILGQDYQDVITLAPYQVVWLKGSNV